ncbi:MAG: amidohydrolase [Spirochaetes bacterium]|nr:amidohydrolase [Spirochaetota bacterium]
MNIFHSKQDILTDFPEISLSEQGDFFLKKEIGKQFEIIDFHTHIFESISSIVPSFLHNPINNDLETCFFDLSPYPEKIEYFCFESVFYRSWPHSFWSKKGLRTFFTLLGYPKVVKLLNSASIERLMIDMSKSSINGSVIHVIADKKNQNTRFTYDKIKSHPNIWLFGSIHPFSKNKEKTVDQFLNLGVKGFKINPHVWKIDFDHPENITLLKILAKTGLPILSCSGFPISPDIRKMPGYLKKMIYTQDLNKYEKVLDQLPAFPFIFAHGGLLQHKILIQLMKKFPHTFTDISTQTIGTIKNFLSEVGCHRLLFGSDYPFFNPVFPLIALLRATHHDEERATILSGNAKKLLNLP